VLGNRWRPIGGRFPQLGDPGSMTIECRIQFNFAALRLGDVQLVADGARGCFLDFTVAGHSCASSILGISIDRVLSSLAVQVASATFQMADKIPTFHAAGRSMVSVSQIALPGASLAALSR
jgi:hypothetical protein